MSLEEIRALRNASPFRPFDLTLTDGRKIHVARPERIAIAPWGRLSIFEGNVPFLPHVRDVVSADFQGGETLAAQ